MEIALGTFQLTQNFPTTERYGLTSQMNRSAMSISSNIAEGSSRQSQKEYKRFIEIALGSCFELETQLLIARSVNFAVENEIDVLLGMIMEEQKMILAFINTLKI